MKSSTHPGRAYTAEDLVSVAERWGYRSRLHGGTENSDEKPVSTGCLSTFAFRSGIRVCFSQLVAHYSHERGALFERSLGMRLVTSDQGDEYRLAHGHRFPIAKGGCVVIDAPDDLYLSSDQQAGRCVAGLFLDACPERIGDAELAERITKRLCGTRIAPVEVDTRFCAFAARMCHQQTADPIARLRIESCALELLACALEDVGDRTRISKVLAADMAGVRRVCEYIVAAPEHEHSLSELAAIAGMSISTLKRKFQTTTGQSVFGFVRDTRLERARLALESGERTVKQAAWLAGYAHTNNFSAAYRRKYGRSPGR